MTKNTIRLNISTIFSKNFLVNQKDFLIGRGTTPGTIVHESVHKLRHNDENRKGHTASKIGEHEAAIRANEENKADRIRAMEEAETECETVARLSPYEINKDRTSYYGCITKTEKEAKTKIDEDRKRLVGNADLAKKGIRGKKIEKTIEKEFDQTHISKYAKKK